MPQQDAPKQPRYELVDFDEVPATPCPCGTARRAFTDTKSFPGTLHRTSISTDAVTHYHKKLTEVYYILECGENAKMQLDDDTIELHAGMCVLIPPGVRHRAIGKMEVLIVCQPKFNEADEWFD